MNSLPFFAFGFASPWLLWGLALGSLPIIVHLFYKRRYRETPWAAMRFLLEAARKNSRRIRLEQLLLLAVRTLILVLLALALARPYVEALGTYFPAEAATHRVLVVDASFSMGHQPSGFGRTANAGAENAAADGGRHRSVDFKPREADGTRADGTRSVPATLFDRAKEAARSIVSSARQGDSFNLVRISDSAPRVVVRQPAHQKSQVLAEIEQLRLTEEHGDVVTTLERVVELLRGVGVQPAGEESSAGRTILSDDQQTDRIVRPTTVRPTTAGQAGSLPYEVYLISDFQRENWLPAASERQTRIRQLLRQISEQARLVLIDLGQPRASNVAVTRFVAEEPFVTVGRPVRLQVSVRNFGETPLSGQLLELLLDGRVVETKWIDLPPGVETLTEFTVSPTTSGEHRLEVRLEDDALDVDNRRWLSLPAKDELNVLLVNGKQSGRPKENATFYLKAALSPSLPDKPWPGVIRPHVVGEGELPGIDLARYDCVFLCNVGLFTQREADLLQAYVESGGGVVFCLGDQVQADNYNQVLYRDGKGVLPAQLGDRKGNAAAPVEAFKFDPDNLEHPIVNPFQGNPGTGLETTLTLEYIQAFPKVAGTLRVPSAAEPQPRVVLKFTTGDPAIVEATVGRGKAVLVTTAVDASWSTWAPASGSFVPVMNEIVKYAVSGRGGQRQLLVGEPLTRVFPVRAFEMPVTVEPPGGIPQAVRIAESEDLATLSYEGTNKSGIYEVALGPPVNRTELFAVNIDPQESDLAKLDEKDLRTELLPGADFIYRTKWQELERRGGVTVSSNGGITRWLLAAVFCLVLVEQLMAWNFFYGLFLLYTVLALAFVRQTWTWNSAWALVLLLVFATALVLVIRTARRSSSVVLPRHPWA